MSAGNLYFAYTTRADRDKTFKCNIKNAFVDNEAGSSTYRVSLAGGGLLLFIYETNNIKDSRSRC